MKNRNNVRNVIQKNNTSLNKKLIEAGINRGHFYQIAKGNAIPRIDTAYKIANVLNVDIKELFPDIYSK